MNQLDLFYRPVYFNTTSKTGEDLDKARVKVTGQTEAVLEFFQDHPNLSFTPWEVMRNMEQRGWVMMVTSIRRAITTLTDAGYLVKTEERRKSGPANETNYTWKLKP